MSPVLVLFMKISGMSLYVLGRLYCPDPLQEIFEV